MPVHSIYGKPMPVQCPCTYPADESGINVFPADWGDCEIRIL